MVRNHRGRPLPLVSALNECKSGRGSWSKFGGTAAFAEDENENKKLNATRCAQNPILQTLVTFERNGIFRLGKRQNTQNLL